MDPEDGTVGSMEPPPYSAWIFIIPSLLDFLATCLMGVGLLLTYASTFQMLRGSVVVFTSLISLLFLGKNLRAAQWIGLSILVCLMFFSFFTTAFFIIIVLLG